MRISAETLRIACQRLARVQLMRSKGQRALESNCGGVQKTWQAYTIIGIGASRCIRGRRPVIAIGIAKITASEGQNKVIATLRQPSC